MPNEILSTYVYPHLHFKHNRLVKREEVVFLNYDELTHLNLKTLIPVELHNSISGEEIFDNIMCITIDVMEKYKLFNSLIDNKDIWFFDVNKPKLCYTKMHVLLSLLEEPCNNTYNGYINDPHLNILIYTFKRFVEEYNAEIDIHSNLMLQEFEDEDEYIDIMYFIVKSGLFYDKRSTKDRMSKINDFKKYIIDVYNNRISDYIDKKDDIINDLSNQLLLVDVDVRRKQKKC